MVTTAAILWMSSPNGVSCSIHVIQLAGNLDDRIPERRLNLQLHGEPLRCREIGDPSFLDEPRSGIEPPSQLQFDLLSKRHSDTTVPA
jgi:hypothetical protein